MPAIRSPKGKGKDVSVAGPSRPRQQVGCPYAGAILNQLFTCCFNREVMSILVESADLWLAGKVIFRVMPRSMMTRMPGT